MDNSRDVDVLTMGCEAQLTLLAMGSGATSGYEGGNGGRFRKGGGGSGFVAVAENITVVYTNK